MDAEAVSAALSPASLAPPIAKELGLPADAVEAALQLLAGGAQPAFLIRYRPERIGALSISQLERIQARAARAVAFVFKRQEAAAELQRRKVDAPYLLEHLASAEHEVDLDDLQALSRKRKRGPAMKARNAGLTAAAAALLRRGSDSPLADVAASQIAADKQRAAQANKPSTKPANKPPQNKAAQATSAPADPASAQPVPADAPSSDASRSDASRSDASSSDAPSAASEATATREASAEAAPSTPAEEASAPAGDAAPAEESAASQEQEPDPVAQEPEPEAPATADSETSGGTTDAQGDAPDDNSQPDSGDGQTAERGGADAFDVEQIVATLEAGEVPDDARAVQGMRLICGELMAEHPPLRRRLRRLLWSKGRLRSSVVESKKDRAGRFAKFFDRSEQVRGVASTNVLSLHRGEREGMLAVDIEVDDEAVVQAVVEELSIDVDSPAGAQVRQAALEAWAHGLGRAVKAGVRKELKQRADRDAIGDLCEALRPLLLAPAFGPKPVMGIDAGQQHGCRLAVLDAQGKVLAEDTVFPLQPKMQVPQAKARIAELVKQHEIAGIVVGSSGPGREVERLCRQLQREDEALGQLVVASMDADAASLFASSRPGKDEFPKSDAAFRRAVSLARRMQDPLRELVKLDVRKFGLGSHQHDVDQESLRNAFDQVMTSCVSAVTLDVNQADAAALVPVAGLSQALSKALVGVRETKGGYRTRAELLDVPGMAGRAFEQSAGFLRVVGGEQPLDATLIHPERYGQITEMARELGVTVGDLFEQPELLDKLQPDPYLGKPGLSGEPLGRPSFDFILDQLRHKQVDFRPAFETVEFNPDLGTFEDLQVGMELEGIVTHLAAFGAFVDVGLAQEGLVHVSELSHEFVNNPLDAVHVGQKVKGRVIEISPERKRFSLSVKALLPRPDRPPRRKEGRPGKKPKKGEGARPRKGGRDGGKDRRPPKKDKTLEFRMDLSDLARLLDE